MVEGKEDRGDTLSYGARLAEDYDSIYGEVFDTEGAIDFVSAMAPRGRVLELGVGTGRIALPLAARGLEVWGVDTSPEMLEKLKLKRDGDRVTTVCGDFGTVDATDAGSFDLVLLLVNTLFAMPTQEHQVACFANAARHLSPGGRFVVEAWVPDPPRDADGLALRARRLGRGYAGLVVEDHDAARQVLATHQIVISESGGNIRSFPIEHRYAWPAEMDLMARIAGMTLQERWADWHRRPFDAASIDHVSVWRRPPS